MGSAGFIHFVETDSSDPRTALRHGRFYGIETLEKKNGVSEVDSTPRTLDEATMIAEKRLNAFDGDDDAQLPPYLDPWDNPGALRIASADSFTIDTVTVPLTILSASPNLNVSAAYDQAVSQLPHGTRVTAMRVVSKKQQRQTTVQATVGKVVTEYLIVRTGTLKQVGDTTFTSQSAARKVLATLINDEAASWSSLDVIGVRRRETGEGLVHANVTDVTFKVDVELTTVTPNGAPTMTGWVFYGYEKV